MYVSAGLCELAQCEHGCSVDADTKMAVCSCRDGFNLAADGKSCEGMLQGQI